MALPLPPGLTPPEIAFLCEMELVTVIPRQRLEGLELLGVGVPLHPAMLACGPIEPLVPPHRTDIPLWLALLLKRQRRANILPPPWLNTHSLNAILEHEIEYAETFSPPPRLPPQPSNNTLPISPPFLPNSTAGGAPDALPYHWLELGEMLLETASDDFEEPDNVRKLLRGLRELRMAKLRSGVEVLDAGGGFKMNGVGGMEVGEGRTFITGVIDGLRKIAASREQQRKDRDREEAENGYAGTADYDDDEMDMQ
ncbi:DNA replication complex GINS protein [Alternaria alternata]|uniref:DNA replication complex GINS protein PSF2 n=1 Tax=Alternaria alternata TaxID=5599 RepID=A0A4Q4N4I7_ALTAL|nr:DNA replication complex GINS protein [Alternaria alternata]